MGEWVSRFLPDGAFVFVDVLVFRFMNQGVPAFIRDLERFACSHLRDLDVLLVISAVYAEDGRSSICCV